MDWLSLLPHWLKGCDGLIIPAAALARRNRCDGCPCRRTGEKELMDWLSLLPHWQKGIDAMIIPDAALAKRK